MDGITLRAGTAVAVSRLRNPVLAARLVMDQSPHVLLTGARRGGEICRRARDGYGLARSFSTEERYRQ